MLWRAALLSAVRYAAYPALASFSMLWTRQKSFHCPSTLLRVLRATRRRVNLRFHPGRVRLRCGLRAPAEERDLACDGCLRRPQALRAEPAPETHTARMKTQIDSPSGRAH